MTQNKNRNKCCTNYFTTLKLHHLWCASCLTELRDSEAVELQGSTPLVSSLPLHTTKCHSNHLRALQHIYGISEPNIILHSPSWLFKWPFTNKLNPKILYSLLVSLIRQKLSSPWSNSSSCQCGQTVSELRQPAGLLFIPEVIYEYGVPRSSDIFTWD